MHSLYTDNHAIMICMLARKRPADAGWLTADRSPAELAPSTTIRVVDSSNFSGRHATSHPNITYASGRPQTEPRSYRIRAPRSHMLPSKQEAAATDPIDQNMKPVPSKVLPWFHVDQGISRTSDTRTYVQSKKKKRLCLRRLRLRHSGAGGLAFIGQSPTLGGWPFTFITSAASTPVRRVDYFHRVDSGPPRRLLPDRKSVV